MSDSRLNLLDRYIASMKAGRGDNPQQFYWEEGGLLLEDGSLFSDYHERQSSLVRVQILKRCRESGVKVKQFAGGFQIMV